MRSNPYKQYNNMALVYHKLSIFKTFFAQSLPSQRIKNYEAAHFKPKKEEQQRSHEFWDHSLQTKKMKKKHEHMSLEEKNRSLKALQD